MRDRPMRGLPVHRLESWCVRCPTVTIAMSLLSRVNKLSAIKYHHGNPSHPQFLFLVNIKSWTWQGPIPRVCNTSLLVLCSLSTKIIPIYFLINLGLSISCSSLEECIIDGSKQIGLYFQKLINYSKEIKITKEEEDTCKTIILVFIIVVVYGLLINFFFSQLSPDDEKTCQKKFAADMELTNVRVIKMHTYDMPASRITKKTEKK